MLVKSCALCAASSCVKCTTYTGLLPSADEAFERLRQRQFGIGVLQRHRAVAATDTVTVGRPFSRVSSSSKNAVSPSVADISRNRACGNVSNGTCHATPRSRSA